MTNDFFNFTTPLSAGTKARAEAVNAFMTAIETGFAKLPTLDQFAQRTFNYLTATGTNTYAVTMSIVPTSYVSGMQVYFKVSNTSTVTNPTLNVNGLGAKTIKQYDGSALAVGDVVAGKPTLVVYNGTDFLMMAPTPSYLVAAAASASAASASASAASASQSAASASASAAALSETNAGNSESAAAASETAAGLSETAAASSASSASSSASSASSSASAASASAGAASTSETNAAASASAASTSETNAAASETAAALSESTASTAAASAADSYDAFDDRYLGSKTADPALDNDGNPLLGGALYWNSVDQRMYVYNGTAWVTLYGYLEAGTVALPGLAFATDTDTGMYLKGANEIGFATNGALALRLGPFQAAYVGQALYVGDGKVTGGASAGLVGYDGDDFVLRPGNAAGGYDATKDFYYDQSLSLWRFDGNLKVDADITAATVKRGGNDLGWEVLASTEGSTSSANVDVDFSSVTFANYQAIKIVVEELLLQTDGADLQGQISQSTTWRLTANYYGGNTVNGVSGGPYGPLNAITLFPTAEVGTNDEGIFGEISLRMYGAKRPVVRFEMAGGFNDPVQLAMVVGIAKWNSNTGFIDRFRFKASSGNIESWSIKVIGLPK